MRIELQWAVAALLGGGSMPIFADESVESAWTDPSKGYLGATEPLVCAGYRSEDELWNWHAQNTDIVQGHPAFAAQYSGPNSLENRAEVRETISLDLLAGLRLWRGAEAHADGLMWQGFGLSKTLGLEAFPNGEAFRLGTDIPNVNLCRIFLRQTIGLGGEREVIADDALHLSGKQDVSRLTLTLGRMSAKDVFDNNAYANDPRTQFMNWAFMANEAWDYPSDSLGYMTGLTLELNQPSGAVRCGWFQVDRHANGVALDGNLFKARGLVMELEGRYGLRDCRGVVRLLAFVNRADMGSYEAALVSTRRPADIKASRAYRNKYGFGLNIEHELTRSVGLFSRLGWSDGHNEAWAFADVDRTATLGLSIKGELWGRPLDTVGLAGAINGISHVHQDFLAAGGTGILVGDGKLHYGLEKALEAYYDCRLWKSVHGALDFQFISDPAFNRDRGPVVVWGARLHWDL